MQGHQARPYVRFVLMLTLSFASMYALMYAMVDTFGNVLPNTNQAYMAGVMAAAMAIIELAVMGPMYPNRKVNALAVALAIVALAAFWLAIREQAAISDRQFLKSMIPHHGGAILMCGESSLQDPEIKRLCAGIVASQQAEIVQMKAKLEEIDRR